MPSILFPLTALAITGPYYLGFDCPDSCCDRVPDCADLPGSYDSGETRAFLTGCLQAVQPDCYITARLGFLAAGFDVYNYVVGQYEDKSYASTAAISFEDMFRVYPHMLMDPVGYLTVGGSASGCNWVDACLKFGDDEKGASCSNVDPVVDHSGADMLIGIWPSNNNTAGGTAGFRFNSHRMSFDYSHLVFYLDKLTDDKSPMGCPGTMGNADGSDIWAAVTGTIPNFRLTDTYETQSRFGTPARPSAPPVSSSASSASPASSTSAAAR